MNLNFIPFLLVLFCVVLYTFLFRIMIDNKMPAHIDSEIQKHVDSFLNTMKQNKMLGSFDTAVEVVLLLRKLVGNSSWSNAKELIDVIKVVSKQIMDYNSSEVIGNMVRRVLKLVREVYSGTIGKDIEGG